MYVHSWEQSVCNLYHNLTHRRPAACQLVLLASPMSVRYAVTVHIPDGECPNSGPVFESRPARRYLLQLSYTKVPYSVHYWIPCSVGRHCAINTHNEYWWSIGHSQRTASALGGQDRAKRLLPSWSLPANTGPCFCPPVVTEQFNVETKSASYTFSLNLWIAFYFKCIKDTKVHSSNIVVVNSCGFAWSYPYCTDLEITWMLRLMWNCHPNPLVLNPSSAILLPLIGWLSSK